MKNTSKGPWAALAISPIKALVIDADGMTVAKLEGENAVSDSYLIETAPEMLAALKVFAEIQSRGKTHSDAFLNEVLRIIKKAQP